MTIPKCGRCGLEYLPGAVGQTYTSPTVPEANRCRHCYGVVVTGIKPTVTPAPSTKDTNPKSACSEKKVPLSYFPATALSQGALALFAGACKYGRNNWRHAGVRVSTYYDAMLRHGTAWWEGEDFDPEDGVHHLGHLLACAAIVLDAAACGMLTDDRPARTGWPSTLKTANDDVVRIRATYADRPAPKHYTKEQTTP